MRIEPRSGFTLVELAVVMAVIGILIGGVLKGQELLRNAQLKRTYADVAALGAAHMGFLDKYSQLPGDMVTATSRIQGCGGMTAGGNWCADGNGDSRVGLTLGLQPGGGSNEGHLQSGLLSMPEVETTLYFRHLLGAELIKGVGIHNPGDPTLGSTHPGVPFGGGITVFWSNRSGDYGAGLIYRWTKTVVPIGGAARNTIYGIISPNDAENFDRKYDDGLPDAGFIQADFAGVPASEWCDNKIGGIAQYNRHNKPACEMYFSVAGF